MEGKLELMVKNGYDIQIQHPQITKKQLKFFQPYPKKFSVGLCYCSRPLPKDFNWSMTNCTLNGKNFTSQHVMQYSD